jgi:hypothetical protein
MLFNKYFQIVLLTLLLPVSSTLAAVNFTCYRDFDGDGFGDPEQSLSYSDTIPFGFVLNANDCDDSNATVYPNAPEICYDGIDNNCNGELNESCVEFITQLRSSHCNQIVPTLVYPIRANGISENLIPEGVIILAYRFKIRNLTTNQISIVENPTSALQLAQSAVAMYDCAFEISVALKLNNEWMPYGNACVVYSPGIPVIKLHPTSCGVPVMNMNSIIRSEIIPKANRYEFEVSLVENGEITETVSLIRPAASLNLLLVNGISKKFETEYRIRAKVEVLTPQGYQWSPDFGLYCSVFSPIRPEISMEGCENEGGLQPDNLLSVLYSKSTGGVTEFRFTLSHEDGYLQTYTSTYRTFRLSNFDSLSPLTPGENYSLATEIKIYGFYYFAKDCNILVPGTGQRFSEEASESSIQTEEKDTSFVVYPNPTETFFQLRKVNHKPAQVSLELFDVYGRTVEKKEANLANETITFGDTLPAGFYLLNVTQNQVSTFYNLIKK